jgi:hypothetical protein
MDISQVFTYQDCLDHLVQYEGGAPDDAMLARMRTAVQMAYQEVCWSTDWQYFHKPLRIQLSAFYETGTVAYTSSTRTLTLSGGTFPTWAAYGGRVLIDNIAYGVHARTDGTNLVLDEIFCPQANIAAGTTYRLYRSVYILPVDFRKVYEFTGEDTWTSCFTTPTEWLKRERYTQDTGTPWLWTIMQTAEVFGYGRYGLYVQGYPDTDETFDCIYVRAPRDIKYSGYETAARAGTVSCTASTTVTGSSTTFSSDMVGSVIRFTSSTTYPGGIHTTNPYVEQHVISAVGSATGLTLDTAATGTYSGKKYIITDPVDLPPSCRMAMLRCCERQLDNVLPNLERLKRSDPAATWAIREARERESLTAYRAIDSWGSHSSWRDQLGDDLT